MLYISIKLCSGEHMNTKKKYKKTQTACYLGFITQAICANFAPLLYLTFYREYGISLGKLALISASLFFVQMAVDLVCAKYVDGIGYRKCAVAAQLLSGIGIAGLAFLPEMMPSPFAGILICTVIYAVGSGLIEVIGSPIIEACPFENKEQSMSLLHSFYCWGTMGVILGSTAFFVIFGAENWRYLALIWALIPLYNIYNFAVCPIEPLVKDGESMSIRGLFGTKLFWLLIVLMVCAGASELAMAQWASALAEATLKVSKTVGDLAGPCGFALAMGICRALYAKYGERVDLRVFMLCSGALCVLSYLLVAFSDASGVGLLGCILCGFSVGIMWPGSISISSAALPNGGTAMFALLALSGDLGGAIGPAIVGTISQRMGDDLQRGVLAGIVFPLVLCLSVIILRRRENKEK